MKVYAGDRSRRTRQQLTDVAVVVWAGLWLWLADVVRRATLGLAAPGHEIEAAGVRLASELRDAGRSLGDLPLLGDQAGAPFDGAGRAADRMAAAGASQAQAVEHLALWLAVPVAAVPILVVLAVYLPRRWRFVREATAGQRLVESSADLELFALRAMAHQPMHRLARVSADPVGAWRSGDAAAVRSLALLELRDAGLVPPGRVVAGDAG
jgi:hypothetical protein